MKRKLKIILISLSFFLLCSCERTKESITKESIIKGIQIKKRDYYIEQYSGGKLIKTYEFNGMLNDSQSSDGYYFYRNDTLYELSGDLVIKSIRPKSVN